LGENNEKLIEDCSVDAVEKVGLDRQHDVQVPRRIIPEKQNKIITISMASNSLLRWYLFLEKSLCTEDNRRPNSQQLSWFSA
jgi:hypothetical protein